MARDFGLLVLTGILAIFVARTLGPDMFAGTLPGAPDKLILTEVLGERALAVDEFFQGMDFLKKFLIIHFKKNPIFGGFCGSIS